MWPFSTTPKPNPKITVDGIEFEFSREFDSWSFTYRGVEFSSSGPQLHLPSKPDFDAILATIESLRGQMQVRIADGLREHGAEPEEDYPTEGRSYSVDVQEFAAERSFVIQWSLGEEPTWGVFFTIRDGEIVGEEWGD